MNWAKFDTGGEDADSLVLWEDSERKTSRTWRSDTLGARHRCMAVVAAKTAPGSVMRLAHEYALKEHLDGAWALRPLELVQEPGRTTLVLEDPGGELLSQLIGAPIAVERFLRLAIGITAAVLKMHQHGLVHKDIKPANVLVDRTDGAVRLTGFGIASRFPREWQPPGSPELIAGTLAYMAPEQTGRMNRSIDSRSDLYALGVTFYEMLTGRLPFYADDAVEWIHCHVARQAQSPSERVPGVPHALSAIVMKLLAKAAEDRYQTAAGLQHDLERCLSEWDRWHRVEPFALGERDIPSRLLIPEKLYGRAREIETLLAAFDDVAANGMPQQVLVSGYSGIGKSAVVHELLRVLDLKRALFASGKFDQYKRDVPYATLAQAFQGLIRELLGRTESELRDWRDRLVQALEPNGLLMVDLVPELKLVIGEQPAVPELPALEAKARFQLVFRRFLGVFARAEHPLVLFFDDLQWLDVATLDLVESLLTQPDVHHLLLVGAYRDNEVGLDHPLVRRLDAIRQAGAKTRHIVLAPLARDDLAELLTDSLHCDAERARPLAQLILAKTGGNPFFTIQFISTLVEESLLTFDHACARWCWDLTRIDAKGYTENVADFMAGTLNRLPVETQEVLQLLACVGNGGNMGFLSMLRECTEEEVDAQLWKAQHAELVVHSEGTYRFVHDRVREAAYSMIPHEQRAEIHLRIGNLLTAHTLPGRLEEVIFEVVAQFDQCTPLLSSCDAREQVAGLYLVAGRRAKAAAAHASALRYLVSGAALLDEDRWERRHDLAFQLELHRAECEFLTGDLQGADERLAMLSGRVATTVDRSTVECLRVDLFTTLDRPDRAVAVCLDYLATVGIEWPPHPSDAQALREYEQVWSRLGSRVIEDLVELPVMSAPASLATLDVLTKALVPALITDANLLCLTACRIANLSLQHGNSDGSCLGYQWFGMLARTRFGNQDGFRFGRLGFELVDKKGLRRFQGSAYITYVQFVALWTEHARRCCDLVRDAFEATNRIGDLTYATYSLDCLSAMRLIVGDPLAQVQGSADQALEFATRAGFGFMTDVLTTRCRLIRTLRGLTSTFGSFDGDGFDEPSFERHLAGDPRLMVAECWYWIAKLQARFRAGDYPAAVDASEKAQRLVSLLPPVFTETAEYHFYGALCHTASVPSRTAEERRKHMEAAAAHHKQIEAWALNCPENFENRAALVGAELARIEGRELDAERLYERAIRSARANAFISNEALANELAARFHEGRGLETIASAYRAAARSCYLEWGADGKVRQLDQQYPQLRRETERLDPTRTALTAVEQLDLATVTKVLQAVSGEIVLEKLIATIMRVAIEHAGAQRGLLLLPREDGCRILAEAGVIGGEQTVSLRQAEVTAADLPDAALRYVLRTGQPVLLDDACAEHPFSSDDYVRRHRARSVLCLPLLKLNRLVGVIYLENNLVPGAFTPARIAILNLLASEAAVSLEHARLFRDLQEREARVRRLVDSNIIGIVVWHVDGRILDTNDEFLRIVGHARDDLVSGHVRWTDLSPPEWHERDELALEELSQTGTAQAYEKEVIRKDGTRVPVMVGAAMIGETADEGVAFVVDLTERKRAEQALREMEREALLIVDTIPGLVATLTTAGVVEAVNKELVEYCGQGLEAMRQWGTNGTVHSEDMPGAGQIFMQAIAAGEPYVFEARIRRFDGVYRWCQVRGLPLRNAAGQIVRWYSLLSDIDDRKRAEHALLASERNLKLIVDTIPALAWSARPDGSADFFNQHYLDFIGLSTEQAGDWGWTAAVHPDDLDGLAMAWQRILASGRPGDAEARLRRQDGEYRWFLFRTNPLRDDTGNIVKWYGANTDIEDRKRAEAELRRAYDSFSEAQRLSKTGSFITDLVGDEHNWSEETYRIFGFDPGTRVTLQRVQKIIHPDDLPAFEATMARAMTGVNVRFATFRIVGALGAVKHVRGVAHVIEQVGGRPIFVGAVQDVTESMVAEAALSKARSDLAHVARVTSLSTLTASIAHEVNQPLSGILTNANTCLRMLDADPPNLDGARETAKRSIRDGRRAADVVSRLRALFSKREFTLEPVDLNEATREVIALSLFELQSNGVLLQQELAEHLPCVTGDRIQLQQVILNLLRNASEAMAAVDDHPRQLLIRTQRDGDDHVRLTVRDAGMGLDQEAMGRLFEAFYTTKSGGMGIGLSVSRSIIERHHGRIWAEPNEGPGATFCLSIPVAAG